MKPLFFLVLVMASLGGCASITQGTSQVLIFNLDPKEARCSVSRAGDGELGSISSSQNTIVVQKDKDDIVVTCNAPGYQTKSQRVVSAVSGAGLASVAFIDLGITDMITGAMYAYPNPITISMVKN